MTMFSNKQRSERVKRNIIKVKNTNHFQELISSYQTITVRNIRNLFVKNNFTENDSFPP